MTDLVVEIRAALQAAADPAIAPAATGVTGLPLLRTRLDMLPVHEAMIRTGARWDHVDEVSARVGAALRAHPDGVRPLVRR